MNNEKLEMYLTKTKDEISWKKDEIVKAVDNVKYEMEKFSHSLDKLVGEIAKEGLDGDYNISNELSRSLEDLIDVRNEFIHLARFQLALNKIAGANEGHYK